MKIKLLIICLCLLSACGQVLEKEAETLEEKKGQRNEERLKLIQKAISDLKNDEGAYPQQMLVSQISYINYMVNSADQVVGKDVLQRYDALKSELQKIKNEVQ